MTIPAAKTVLTRAMLTAILALSGCHKAVPAQSLVGDFAAPGIYALAGDTITVWQRIKQPDGTWRFHSYAINPGGTVEYLDQPEQGDAPTQGEVEEESSPAGEQRKSFTLSPQEFETLRSSAALLRPASLGPDDPVGGYGGEAIPKGCTASRNQLRTAGINFLNGVNWGSFVLQGGCASEAGSRAEATMSSLFATLDKDVQRSGKPVQ